MPFFATKNLVDPSVEPCVPWEFKSSEQIPNRVLNDKSERENWLQNPKTNYQCYTAFEGVNNRLRISGPRADGEGNPPMFLHAFAGDYDLPLSDQEIDLAVSRMPIKPNWIETSLSGNARLVWLFERSLALPSYAFTLFLLARLYLLLPIRSMAGLDQGALAAPERLLTNGGKWRKVHDVPVSADLLQGFLVSVSEKFCWKSSDLGTEIPLDVAASELKSKYPRFVSWPGDFALGAQGPSFWVDGSESSKSAIVRETGLQTFSAHAHKPFFNWSELLGIEFVSQYQLCEMGRAVDGIYFDGKSFIRKNLEGAWLHEPRDDFNQFLRTERGLNDKRGKGETHSKVDSAVMFVKNNACVEGAGSFAFFPKGLIQLNSKRMLNTHNRDVLQPAAESPGKFPWIAEFLSGFFSSPEQLPYFTSWLSYFYRSCHARTPAPGQNIILVGDVGKGKTLLTRAIMGALMGGATEAKEWLMGQSTFSSDLFEYALWVIDDGSVSSGRNGHRIFSEMLKRMAANETHWSNEKFRKASMVHWLGRIAISCNADVESIRVMPDLDISIREKISLFLAAPERDDNFVFPDRQALKAILNKELPFFARHLLDYQIPDHCLATDARFYVSHYHEPSLVTSANQSSNSGTFGEILDEWMREEFTVRNPSADSWVGTALQLYRSILSDHGLTEAMKPFTVQTVGRLIASLGEKKVFRVVIRGDEHRRIFEIFRDRYPKKPMARGVPESPNSVYHKLEKAV